MLRIIRYRHWLSVVIVIVCLAYLPAQAEVGVTGNQVLLGQSAPLSGSSSELGRLFVAGAQAYFSAVNARGGVHGRKIRLLVLDDQYEPEKTVANTVQLIRQDKVFALFGYVGTPTVAAVLPLINQARVPLFAPMSGASLLRQPFNPLVFNVRASYARETDHMLRQLQGNGKRRIAAFYQDDEFGNSTLQLLRSRVDRYRLQLVATVPVERNTEEVTSAVDAMIEADPDVVVLISTYPSVAALIVNMVAAGYRGGFSTYSFVGSNSLMSRLKGVGVGTVVTQVVPFPWRPHVPIVNEYQKASRAVQNSEYSFVGMEGYIAARALTEGLRRAGPELTRAGLIRALESISPANYADGGFALRFEPGNHNGSDFVDLTAVGFDSRFIN